MVVLVIKKLGTFLGWLKAAVKNFVKTVQTGINRENLDYFCAPNVVHLVQLSVQKSSLDEKEKKEFWKYLDLYGESNPNLLHKMQEC